MDNPEPLSPLAELGQRIYEAAAEARREYHEARLARQNSKAWWLEGKIAALVEVGNYLDRTRRKAEKASVEKPSTAVRSSAWVGVLAEALEREAIDCKISSQVNGAEVREAFHVCNIVLASLANKLRCGEESTPTAKLTPLPPSATVGGTKTI